MDDTTRQKVEESPEERKRRIRRQRMIQDRLRRFLRSKKVQAVSSREKRFKKTGNPGDRRSCADGSGGS